MILARRDSDDGVHVSFCLGWPISKGGGIVGYSPLVLLSLVP